MGVRVNAGERGAHRKLTILLGSEVHGVKHVQNGSWRVQMPHQLIERVRDPRGGLKDS